MGGEAILVHRDLSVGVLPDCDPILSIAVKTSGGNLIRIGNIYSPTSNHAVDDQSAFFHHLQKWSSRPGEWIAGGDWNHNLAEDSPTPATFLIPFQGSWRHSVHYDWGNTLDGFALSTSLLP